MNRYDCDGRRMSSYEVVRWANEQRAIALGELIGDCYLWIAKRFGALFSRT